MKNLINNLKEDAKSSKDRNFKEFYMETCVQVFEMKKNLAKIMWSDMTQTEKIIWNILTDGELHPTNISDEDSNIPEDFGTHQYHDIG